MIVPEYSNMEIDAMNKDELLKAYLQLQDTSNKLDMGMSFIKARMDAVMQTEGIKNYANPLGEFVRVTQQRNNFTVSLAKEMLTPEQIEKCKVSKEISYVKVISTQAKTNQQAAMNNG